MSKTANDIPKRKIVQTCTPLKIARTQRGLVAACVLECAHMSDANATERRRGWLYCFDCFYGKPADRMGLLVVDELAS